MDTFELAEPKQAEFEYMNEGNTARIRRQKRAPIFVVVGNPPYNAWQETENDANKNRKYKELGKRISETYAKASKATNKNALADPYVKAFRFAADRIRQGGLICFVSNDSYVDQLAFDGMRKYLAHEFDKIYVLDLGGNVRKNPKLSGTTHNVFGIQVGVAITLLIKLPGHEITQQGRISYAAVGKDWKKEEKCRFLEDSKSISGVKWRKITPDVQQVWLRDKMGAGFEEFVALKGGVFDLNTNGVKTNRDAWTYNFDRDQLLKNAMKLTTNYNAELDRWARAKPDGRQIDAFLSNDPAFICWSETLKHQLRGGHRAKFDPNEIRSSLYRPFTRQWLYFDSQFVERRYQTNLVFPCEETERENRVIWVKTGSEIPFFVLSANTIPNGLPQGASQCFPLYTYDEDGTNRRENITDWAVAEFRSHYSKKSITKQEIFHYTYALLHHPEYRTRYAANLKRELPRIPFAPAFDDYARIGASLMKLHLEYEQQPEFPLERTETGKLDWRVEKMTLSKDKTQLKYNDFITLSAIPPEVYDYRLGNRSALEWVVDQYRVSTDKRSRIVNDPNREDDPEYIVRLIGQVVTVSLETVRLVRELSTLPLLAESQSQIS